MEATRVRALPLARQLLNGECNCLRKAKEKFDAGDLESIESEKLLMNQTSQEMDPWTGRPAARANQRHAQQHRGQNAQWTRPCCPAPPQGSSSPDQERLL